VDEINPGDTVTKTFTWEAQAASHLFRAIVDKDNTVTEINEANNERTVSLPAPDLAIDNVSWTPSGPSDNTTITFSVTVKNLGGGQSDNSSLSWYIDEERRNPVAVAAINPGDTFVASFTWAAQAGEYVLKMVTDEANDITESNESNNEKITAISVLPQGAAISTQAPEPEISEIVTDEVQEQQPAITENAAASAETSEPPPPEETDDVQETIIPEVAEEPSSIISKLKDGFLQNWLFVAGVGAAGIAAIAVLLVIRKRQSKPSEG
jgi:subtilase family serine protease